MRRAFFVAAFLVAATASAFDATRRPVSIALLAPADRYLDGFEDRVKDELKARGYEVSIANETIKDAGGDPIRADYYVEILGAGGGSRPVADVGAGPVDVGISVSHVATSVNLYDGRTLDLIDTIDLHKRSTNVSPLGIYVGSRPIWAAIALPFFEESHYRNAMRRLARDTARQIDEALRR
jgi:hypothetical protein